MVSRLTSSSNPPGDDELTPNEVNHLLDITGKPALLVSLPELKIEGANLQVSELSGYTRDELLKLHLETLLPKIIGILEDPSRQLTLHSTQGCSLDLITRRKQVISTKVQARKLGEEKRFSLVTLNQLSKERRKELNAGLIFGQYQSLLNLTGAYLEEDLEKALGIIVRSGKELLTASSLGIYAVTSNHPRLTLLAAEDQSGILPDSISTTDFFSHYQEGLFSPPYKPPLSPLQQQSIQQGTSFIVSTPLNDARSVSGMILALGPENTDPPRQETIFSLIKLIGRITEGVIGHFTLTSNLTTQLSEMDKTTVISDTIKKYIPEGLLYLSPELTIKHVNPAAEQVLGYAEEEILNRHIDDVIIGTDRLTPALQDALDGIPTHDLGHLEIHHRDGSAFPSQIRTIPVANPPNQDLEGILVFLQDISKEENVRIRTQQLERRALVGQMNAIFAHEIRNPINNITSGIQLLERTLPEDSSNREVIKGLSDDCDRLTHIVDTVLTFSKSQSYHRNPLDLPQLIDRILNRWLPRMKRTQVKSVTKVEPDLPRVLGDQRALGQVFNNLISNAVRAMQETDGGVLSIRLKSILKQDGKPAVQVDVLDTGPGIPQEVRDHIFEPFFTTKADGTGLGLSITKQIITMHEGTIKLNPMPEGTAFQLILPCEGE
ncbi:MAG: ATP-binding protein [Anaerolineales bacterium]|nr:ATP-binding protein [Anaerolineales bacterium]